MRLRSPDLSNYLIVHAGLAFRADEALIQTEIRICPRVRPVTGHRWHRACSLFLRMSAVIKIPLRRTANSRGWPSSSRNAVSIGDNAAIGLLPRLFPITKDRWNANAK